MYTDVWLNTNSCDIHRQKMWPFILNVVPTNREKISMSTGGRSSSDRRSQTTSWTLRATLAVLLPGFWQHKSIFMSVALQNASYTRADVTGDFDKPARFDWTDISLAVTSGHCLVWCHGGSWAWFKSADIDGLLFPILELSGGNWCQHKIIW